MRSIHNPYLVEFSRLPRDTLFNNPARSFDFATGRDLRAEFTARYAWAVPTQKAVERIARESPIIEIGAGTGYWAYLIDQAGGDIIAFDSNPIPDSANAWHKKSDRSWFDVRKGGPEAILEHPGRTLFLCWPPYAESMAINCLRAYEGNTFIFVGEDENGCTGDDDLWTELGERWNKVESIDLPQWSGLHDCMMIYVRRD